MAGNPDFVNYIREQPEGQNPLPWDAAWPQQMKPTLSEIGAWVGSPLFEAFMAWMGETYQTEPSVEFSKCSMDRGWNIKYKKGSKSLCVLYIRRGWFTAMVTLGAKQVAELETLLPTFSASFRKLYETTPLFNGGKWLSVDVTGPGQLEEVQRLILMKVRPAKKQA